ncbi:hypothetical protein PTSG_06131 [Salpingoeca rosetta]|uniref:Uncharacterized protein n=1 Tax=Salpingoeca rosetta (strain ATCC 50818 / BSB-021) TaxID=946362 RepID=F2UC14_SALR5|nr:uncharacterized protein PTSG_06131 [Salpingoeca rosetta]EGD74121.1 hypothetical protein PTSG_06131 [Salpingoeca rosetta]|eukprot:XP_004993022.1 hypothetical protein PTSG_06131 [Salpingoeca rosetta]
MTGPGAGFQWELVAVHLEHDPRSLFKLMQTCHELLEDMPLRLPKWLLAAAFKKPGANSAFAQLGGGDWERQRFLVHSWLGALWSSSCPALTTVDPLKARTHVRLFLTKVPPKAKQWTQVPKPAQLSLQTRVLPQNWADVEALLASVVQGGGQLGTLQLTIAGTFAELTVPACEKLRLCISGTVDALTVQGADDIVVNATGKKPGCVKACTVSNVRLATVELPPTTTSLSFPTGVTSVFVECTAPGLDISTLRSAASANLRLSQTTDVSPLSSVTGSLALQGGALPAATEVTLNARRVTLLNCPAVKGALVLPNATHVELRNHACRSITCKRHLNVLRVTYDEFLYNPPLPVVVPVLPSAEKVHLSGHHFCNSAKDIAAIAKTSTDVCVRTSGDPRRLASAAIRAKKGNLHVFYEGPWEHFGVVKGLEGSRLFVPNSKARGLLKMAPWLKEVTVTWSRLRSIDVSAMPLLRSLTCKGSPMAKVQGLATLQHLERLHLTCVYLDSDTITCKEVTLSDCAGSATVNDADEVDVVEGEGVSFKLTNVKRLHYKAKKSKFCWRVDIKSATNVGTVEYESVVDPPIANMQDVQHLVLKGCALTKTVAEIAAQVQQVTLHKCTAKDGGAAMPNGTWKQPQPTNAIAPSVAPATDVKA